MARKKATIANPIPARLTDFSGGMNNAVQPAMLNDNESVLLQNYSMDEKGTLFPIKGRRARYLRDSIPAPVNGISPYHRSDGVSRLLVGSGNKLSVDTPRLVEVFDSQAEWEEGSLERINTTTTPGEITPAEPEALEHEEVGAEDMELGTLTSVRVVGDNLERDYTGTDLNEIDDLSTGTLTDVKVVAGALQLESESESFIETTTSDADFNGTHGDTEAVDDSVKLVSAAGSPVAGVTFGGMKSADSNKREAGWEFTVGASDIIVSRLGHGLGYSATVNLWRVTGSVLLASVVTSNWGNITPITLSAGQSYIVSVWMNGGWENYSSSLCTFHSAISYVRGRYTTSSGSFPSTNHSGVAYNANIGILEGGGYVSPGTYTHPVQDISAVGVIGDASITFNKTTPANTALTLEYRLSLNNGVDWGAWTAINSGDTVIPALTDVSNYRLQWRANLSTTDASATPSLDDVTVSINSPYKTLGERLSP